MQYVFIDDQNVKMPGACGAGCGFSYFSEDTDEYVCIFFRRGVERNIVDECAAERTRYINCPVKVVEIESRR